MKANLAIRVAAAALLIATLLLGAVATPAPAFAAQQPQDWDIPGGHFFTQTGRGAQSGYAVTNDNGVAFWDAFQQLGGVNGVGYPVSRRFLWNGFVCQAMQKVVFQWQPESRSVSFVNVFDLMHDTGKDAWLKTVRQTPEPKQWQEDGLAWDQVVKGRLAVMDAFPEIKKAYMGVPGDPIQLNGLPTTDVVDMGNNYILRAQRVVIQQWKEDVPWAKKGQVTFGLGGAIAVESNTLPAEQASTPEEVYTNNQDKYRLLYPFFWRPNEVPGGGPMFQDILMDEPGVSAALVVRTQAAPAGATTEQAVMVLNNPSLRAQFINNTGYDFGQANLVDLGGRKVARIRYGGTEDGVRLEAVMYMFFEGGRTFVIAGAASEVGFPRHEYDFDTVVASIQFIP